MIISTSLSSSDSPNSFLKPVFLFLPCRLLLVFRSHFPAFLYFVLFSFSLLSCPILFLLFFYNNYYISVSIFAHHDPLFIFHLRLLFPSLFFYYYFLCLMFSLSPLFLLAFLFHAMNDGLRQLHSISAFRGSLVAARVHHFYYEYDVHRLLFTHRTVLLPLFEVSPFCTRIYLSTRPYVVPSHSIIWSFLGLYLPFQLSLACIVYNYDVFDSMLPLHRLHHSLSFSRSWCLFPRVFADPYSEISFNMFIASLARSFFNCRYIIFSIKEKYSLK